MDNFIQDQQCEEMNQDQFVVEQEPKNDEQSLQVSAAYDEYTERPGD